MKKRETGLATKVAKKWLDRVRRTWFAPKEKAINEGVGWFSWKGGVEHATCPL